MAKLDFAVIGKPVAHSMSPQIHNFFAAQFDFKNYSYKKILSSKENLKETVNDFFRNGGSGVKPALPYLDIISLIKETFKIPVFAYHVSGEYLMIKSAAKNKSIDEKLIVIETLTCIKRSGASSIITYYAKEVAQWLN